MNSTLIVKLYYKKTIKREEVYFYKGENNLEKR